VATNILHNAGNVLNSVNVSVSLSAATIAGSRSAGLAGVVALMRSHEEHLGDYLARDAAGSNVLQMLGELSEDWSSQQDALAAELESLRANVEHIKRIVSAQQGYAKTSGAAESVDLRELIEGSLRMNADYPADPNVRIECEFEDVAPIRVERHKVLQILVNLVRNAHHACAEMGGACAITLRLSESGGCARITVTDTGSGIAPENLVRVFAHGFTTRKDGHGFGLHSGALDAAELGGSLTADSDGVGRGARFTLELPAIRQGSTP
jgi:signal transduction histidine kinase